MNPHNHNATGLMAQVILLQSGMVDEVVVCGMRVVICSECQEPIIDGDPKGHKFQCGHARVKP